MTDYLDPTEDTVPGDSQSSNQSKRPAQDAWSQFTARPENNAALIQFGLAMMSPRAKGSGFVGGLANSIGQAGEAATANIGAQQAEAERQSKIEERESTADYRQKQGDAATRTAAAYEQQVRSSIPGGANARQALSQKFRVDQAFRAWMAKPEDMLGGDPLLGAVQKQFPNIKTKADLLSDPKAKLAAWQLFSQQLTTEAPDEAGGVPPAAAQPPAPGAAAIPGPGIPAGAKEYPPGSGQWYVRGPDGKKAVPVPR